ncbi:MAG TPA: ABC transporter permease [Candidatus Norongarragalinales archaeon]|nr:ABC transporter permease [Candidatus Norongarragalinales archaeon]
MTSSLDLLEYSLSNMRHRQIRSWLTILGIVIGIASIILLVSVGQGLDKEIKNQLSSFGTNYIIVLPGSPNSGGFSFGPPQLRGVLYQGDADSIRRLPGVKSVSSAVVLGTANLEYKDEKVGSVVVGPEAYAMEDFLTVGFEKGRYLSPGDEGGTVLGNNAAKTLFEEEVQLGKTLKINGREFRVKGILKKAGSFSPYDNFIFIDIGAARKIGKTEGSRRVDRIFAVVNKPEDVPAADIMIQNEIAKRHKVTLDERDFQTQTPQTISDTVSQITGVLSIFLGLIAGISLFVGMVGIANAMFTSVLERTREIGILKAVGATERVIARIFLFESALIGLVGGFAGVLLGGGLSLLISAIGAPSAISLEFVGICLILSIAVGLVSGYFPAKDAARLQPVESLRYE